MDDVLCIYLHNSKRMCDDVEECCLATRQKKIKNTNISEELIVAVQSTALNAYGSQVV